MRNERAFMDATASLLSDGIPFADLGVGQISHGAGFSRPTFYAHFRDKRELLLKMGSELEGDLHSVASTWLEEDGGDLRTTLEGVLAAFKEHSATVGALVEAATYDPEISAFWRSFHELFVQSARGRALREDPSLDVRDAEARAFALVWMTERALTENILAPRVDDDALLDAMERLWRSGIVADQ
ncbi:MAG: TetR/AcrR family transcriptional regulator, ethionamide resistance regulator [Thermoleophilaceae bacterium]|nr:TetR/AcrR family transcriptional regulator, ethionamide resistance regulator [Thermoleophilaceae bacterium]